MNTNRTLDSRRWRALSFGLLGSAVLWSFVASGDTRAQEPSTAIAPAVAPKVAMVPEAERKAVPIATTNVTKGQAIVTTTHSFNVYVFGGGGGRRRGAQSVEVAPTMGPLAQLAKEAGIDGQKQVALQMIGNSTVTQHWNAQGGDDNPIKKALRDGGVDVFTLAPHAQMPEPAIDQFADLACQNNPNIRILAQMSWSSWDGAGSRGTSADGVRFTNEDHNKMTKEALTGRVAAGAENYAERLRKQLAGINERYGRSIGYVVPVSQGVIQLRVAVLDGKVPGAAQQSELFADAMGHPARSNNTYLANLAEYIWFAVMYGKSPVGLKTFVKEGDAQSAQVHKLLQEIALDVVMNEPMSGFPKDAAKRSGIPTPSAN